MTALLKSLPLNEMSDEEVFELVKKTSAKGRKLCTEAELHFKEMKEHYDNITVLMEERNKPETDEEEKRNIAAVLLQVFDAMESRRKREFNNFDENIQSVGDWEKEILATDSGKAANEEIEDERKKFISKYFFHKARLGLQTQNDVAELTGIDRRQISRIENGTKPQFKTLQKIAQAFSIQVDELCGS